MIDLFAFVDLETSGLYRSDLPPDDKTQPNIVQLACLLVDGRERILSRSSLIIRPEGWSIEPEAERIHGISEIVAHQSGVPLFVALTVLRALTEKASLIIGHGLFGFDGKVISSVMRRDGFGGEWWDRSRARWRCTMEAATPVLKLPGQFGDHKFPSLDEAYNHLVAPEKARVSPHNAEMDAEATIAVFFELKRRGAI